MCWYCGNAIKAEEPFGRSESCPDCAKDLRCCRNCRFFLPGSRGDCAESQAEIQLDKERANFCDWFTVHPNWRRATSGETGLKADAAKARSSFKALFGD